MAVLVAVFWLKNLKYGKIGLRRIRRIANPLPDAHKWWPFNPPNPLFRNPLPIDLLAKDRRLLSRVPGQRKAGDSPCRIRPAESAASDLAYRNRPCWK